MTPFRQTLELLAPARNADFGIAAIDHGADAVYIGGPAFGARAGAGNTVADIERPVIDRLVATHGIQAMTYPAGSVMFMNCNLVHASPENLTPRRRTIVYINANSVDNAITRPVRATHHANRDFTALEPIDDRCLLA